MSGATGHPLCDKCAEKLYGGEGQWPLYEACASVGIEHGMSTAQMLVTYLRVYHDRGHQ